MLATTVRDVTLSSLNLHLQDPQVRPEASPWGSTDVEIQASFSSGRHIVSLPCVVGLNTVLAPGADEGFETAAGALQVEVMGCDNGVTFSLGLASVPLPAAGPGLQQPSIADNQFRVCLRGATGARTGTLVGSFQVGGSTGLDQGADEAIGISTLAQPYSTVIGLPDVPASGAAYDREEKEHGASGELFVVVRITLLSTIFHSY